MGVGSGMSSGGSHVWRSAFFGGGGNGSEGHAAGGLDRLANRLRLPPEMKPSTGQRGRLSVKQPRHCPAIPLLDVSKINHRSCHRRQGPLPRPLFSEPGNDEPVASSKERTFVTFSTAVWRQRRKASQCALAMRTPQRKIPAWRRFCAPPVSRAGLRWSAPKLLGWFSSHLCLWSGPSRTLVQWMAASGATQLVPLAG